MVRRVLPGNPPVEILLRPSARARRLSLRVSGIDGRVTLSYPLHALGTAGDGLRDARRRTGSAGSLPGGRTWWPWGRAWRCPVEGRWLTVVPATGRGVKVEEERLLAPGRAARGGGGGASSRRWRGSGWPRRRTGMRRRLGGASGG